jgi:UDP-glucose 4-epimerase
LIAQTKGLGMEGKKILITGSKGLIGHALKSQLQVSGFQVIEIDLRYPQNHSNHGDVRDLKRLEVLSQDCCGIVHLAGVSRVIAGEKNPELCWDMNVNGTHAVLTAALKSISRPWVIYASSREVYGQQTLLPVKESAPLLPVNVYAKSKIAAENAVLEYRAQGLQAAILRFSNVYGSLNDYEDRVIPAFCRAAALGGTIRIDGNHNIFDFTYIEDVVDGIIRAIDALRQGNDDLPAIHFTTGKGTTLLEAAMLAKKSSNFNISFQEMPSRIFDVASFYGDPSFALEHLGWKATVMIEEGINRLVRLFESQSAYASVACV